MFVSRQIWKARLAGALCGVALLAATTAQADYLVRQEVRDYMAELAAEHGFGLDELETLLGRAERKQNILDAISRPAERVLKWHEYRDIFLKEPRVSQGLEFWAENAETLERAQLRYGVPPEYVVAIIGVETRYGRITGSYRVLDALMTLGFDYPPRAGFFRSELTHFLLLAREEGFNPLELKGSYAGAMGYGQFIPSSFRAYAVDFDGDGRRDIWSNRVDAIGSVANYFARHGWTADAPVAIRVDVSGAGTGAVTNDTLDLRHTVGSLRELGIRIDDVAAEAPAVLYQMDGVDGDEYWVGLGNFYVITRYNRSRLYALAVHQLAEEIRQQRAAALAGR
ncbi:MAG: lytic murein transglycosylase B [Pseudomonadales bacterium]|nr:lytic murein transglycosylase B [Pseudomonadales bacterium]